MTADLGAFYADLVGDGQLRWVGPEKGVIQLATAALVNAVWDLYAKVEGKPLWKLLADLPPEAIVRAIPFRYLSDALTPDEALAILRRQRAYASGPRSGAARGRLPGLHDLRRMAGVSGQQGAPPVPVRASRPAGPV